MRRYGTTDIKTRWDGKKVYTITQYPDIPQKDTDITVISNDGDFLDALAFKYYQDPTLWWILALTNNIGKGKMSVPGGLQLRVPTDINNILNEFNNLNNK
jgi:phage tail protein X